MAFEFLNQHLGLLVGGAAFPIAVGIGSSFTHCAGMCGPIHFFLASKSTRSHSIWLYHLGRISGYTLIGACLGILSQIFTGLSSTGFRLTAGILLALLYSLFGLGLLGWLPSAMNLEKNLGFLFPAKLFSRISNLGSRPQLLFPAGLMASLLPCPSTHAVMLWTMGLDSAWKAAGSMAMLGIATLPVFMVLPTRFFSRPAWSGRIYQGLLGVLFLGLSAWRIYGLATNGPGSCH
jgi:uncharacterized protein